jgi:hypothetical protein
MNTIYCQKELNSNLWCFDYSFSDELIVAKEPLMHQATNVIDFVLKKKYKTTPKTISIIFDYLNLSDADVHLKYKEPSAGGSLYRTTQELVMPIPSQDVWLCPVLTYFYPQPPEELYVLITEEKESKI